MVAEIIELDADNKAGLKTKFDGLKNSVEFKSELEATMSSNRGKPEDIPVSYTHLTLPTNREV